MVEEQTIGKGDADRFMTVVWPRACMQLDGNTSKMLNVRKHCTKWEQRDRRQWQASGRGNLSRERLEDGV